MHELNNFGICYKLSQFCLPLNSKLYARLISLVALNAVDQSSASLLLRLYKCIIVITCLYLYIPYCLPMNGGIQVCYKKAEQQTANLWTNN